MAMATTTPDLTIDDIRQAASAAAAHASISRVYLFGSRARGDNEIGSDIDLAFETGAGFSLVDVGLYCESEDRVSARR
jgi:predicted nucleotidyltransferase